MRVFEIHFNPRKKEDKIIGTFSYEPANVYEKRMGSLYMSGELKQVLPQNTRLLNNLASIIHKEYYSAGLKKSCGQSLQDCLKKANEFLDAEVKKGNVSWLGNLDFSVLSFSNFVLNFTKIGDMKILLIRNNELLDISQNLESQEMANHSLKVFGSIAMGKLTQDDKVVVLNKEIFSVLTRDKDFSRQLKQITDERELKEVLKRKKQTLTEISGACLFLLINEGLTTKQILSFRQEAPPFSFRKTFIRPITKLIPSFKLPIFKLPSFKLPSLKLPTFKPPKFTLPRLRLPQIKLIISKKNLVLVLVLVLVLTAFFFLFQGEREIELQEAQQKIAEAQSKIIMAENLLILEEKNKAQVLFQEAWDIVNPLTKAGMPLREEALAIKKLLKDYLK